jgi:GAF domain-containing protein
VLEALNIILVGESLNEVLTSITHVIEAHSKGILCSIFLLDEDGLHLRYGAAANLPQAYKFATDGTCIGPNVGSCGAAAYLGKPVFISDILSHPNWANFRNAVLNSGLRAAWSSPTDDHERVRSERRSGFSSEFHLKSNSGCSAKMGGIHGFCFATSRY